MTLLAEYVAKAWAADHRQGVQEGEVGRVKAKLVGMGDVCVVVSGNLGKMSVKPRFATDSDI